MQKKQATPSKSAYIPRLKTKYKEEIVPSLMKKLEYTTPMQVPKIEAICINRGVGKIKSNEKLIETLLSELTQVAGQKAVFTKAKKPISNFKLRAGNVIGCRVTLRGVRMYEFLDRLITIYLPRIRDFRGTTPNLDGKGNYTIGIREQLIFTELDIDKISHMTGMNITIKTSAGEDTSGKALLEAFGIPFKKTKK